MRERKMRRAIWTVAATIAAAAMLLGFESAASSDERAGLLKVREAVWRAWFANDRKALEKLVPPDTIAISAGEEKWKHQAEIFQSAAEFQASGGKLLRLEFPRTEIQRFGDVAILYSQYLVETEAGGKQSLESGRVTEIFVLRHGTWTNPGWHTDSQK
jgi:ketosteroid isomerase-like protein